MARVYPRVADRQETWALRGIGRPFEEPENALKLRYARADNEHVTCADSLSDLE